MFIECSSLKELNLSNFKINNMTNIRSLFLGCSNELVKKIKAQNTSLKT